MEELGRPLEVPCFIAPLPPEDEGPLVSPGAVMLIIGAQFGNEGVEKIVHHLSNQYKIDIVARYQNGYNRNLRLGERNVQLELLPSGIIKPNILNVLGPGYQISPDQLIKELESVRIGNEDAKDRVMISPYAQLFLRLRNRHNLPSTSSSVREYRGIRTEYTILQLIEEFDYVSAQFNNMQNYLRSQRHDLQIDGQSLRIIRDCLEKMNIIQKDYRFLIKALNEGKSILVEIEGILMEGSFDVEPVSLLDIERGLSIPKAFIKRKLGVCKAYMTSSTFEYFPSACGQSNPDSELLRQFEIDNGIDLGQNRCYGYLDLTILRKAKSLNSFHTMALTCLHALSAFEKIHVTVGFELDGELIDYPPEFENARMRATIIFKIFPGWKGESIDVWNYTDMPLACKRLICYIESICEVPLVLIEVDNFRFIERSGGEINDFGGVWRKNEIKMAFSDQLGRHYNGMVTRPVYLAAQRLRDQEDRLWAIEQRKKVREQEQRRAQQQPVPFYIRVRDFIRELIERMGCFS